MFGYLLLLTMGFILGLVGAGGAIMTIPILVYAFKLPPFLATTYSLIIVGSVSLVGCLRAVRQISFEKIFAFLIPSLCGIFFARHFLFPNLPHTIGAIQTETLLLFVLISLMWSASYFMISERTFITTIGIQKTLTSHIQSAFIGLIFGCAMGLVGSGGGFFLIPILVLLLNVPMHNAIPTSLFIVTLNSLIGFLSDKTLLLPMDYHRLLQFIAMALVGMMIGLFAQKKSKHLNLKKLFGYFVLFVSCCMLIKELFVLGFIPS